MNISALLRTAVAAVLIVSNAPIHAASADGVSSRWTLVAAQRLEHHQHVAGFVDKAHGLTVGYAGETHYARSGTDWKRADDTDGACRYGLDMLDAETAWSCGNFGRVRMTRDGGAHWRELADFGLDVPDHCRYLSFADRRHGWAATPDELAVTDDGGQRWQTADLPQAIGSMIAVSLLNARHGYVLDDNGQLFMTDDGGKSWERKRVDLDPGQLLPRLKFPTVAMRFTDPAHGLVVASYRGDRLMALTTEDGGATWRKERLPVGAGALFLSRDARMLTVTDWSGSDLYVLQAGPDKN